MENTLKPLLIKNFLLLIMMMTKKIIIIFKIKYMITLIAIGMKIIWIKIVVFSIAMFLIWKEKVISRNLVLEKEGLKILSGLSKI